LTENYLVAEAAADKAPKSDGAGKQAKEMMAGWTLEDFLGPEMAKTRD
jgi:hypothetical protein